MTDTTPEDFVDFLRCLVTAECDFVVVGAHALAVHGSPRATGDLEALVDAVVGTIGDVTVRCIGLEAMLTNKLAAGRAKDLADAEVLKQLRDLRR